MRYNPLGRTGLFVSELALGTMTFGGTEGMWKNMGGLGQSDADAMVKTAIDSGINFIDTADVYASGKSEEIAGAALRNLGIRREEIVVATKAFGQMTGNPNGRGTSRYHLMNAVDASLARLGLDHIDLYQIHGFDAATPIEEQLRGLDAIVASGRVRYVGVSNWAAWQVMKALGLSERHGLARFASLQAFYTLATRDLEREIVPMLKAEGVGLMVWSPLAGGLLSGKYRDGAPEDGRLKGDGAGLPVPKARAGAVIDAMRPIAEAHGASVAQVAIAWLLHQPVVTSVIVGAKRPDQLSDNIGACTIVLTPDDLAALGTASALPPEYPGWMIANQGAFRRGQLNPPPRGAE
ncbi:aldo/keto reductase [Polymorphobacter megasporae]|uniref:aldo/keto reductase n=1 Tax=Glacieibacterium megasporae TaxID=2835787 RepID=UPI001C1DE9CE|nr:aldo/keto reductase [Polymorphobacter megasporae]UAJ10189.1 aldo/keto reductase [Polymorphobacter megasporae]